VDVVSVGSGNLVLPMDSEYGVEERCLRYIALFSDHGCVICRPG